MHFQKHKFQVRAERPVFMVRNCQKYLVFDRSPADICALTLGRLFFFISSHNLSTALPHRPDVRFLCTRKGKARRQQELCRSRSRQSCLAGFQGLSRMLSLAQITRIKMKPRLTFADYSPLKDWHLKRRDKCRST